MYRRRWLVGASLSAMLLALGTTALAADLAPGPYVEPEGLYNWSGLYVGGHAGYIDLDGDGFFATSVDLSFCGGGFLAGGQVGWNWQRGHLVLGVEDDFSFFDCQDANLREEKYIAETDFLATMRGRVGWANDNVLFYGTGGLAYLSAQVKTSIGGLDEDQQGNTDSKDVSSFGAVVGGGIEWGVSRNFSIKAEGLYLFFDKKTSLVDLEEGCAAGDEECLEDVSNFFAIDDGFIFRLGANWRIWGPRNGHTAEEGLDHAGGYEWGGFYIGPHVGYGGVGADGVYLNDRISPVPHPAPIDLGEFHNYGLLGGVQAGFNWQIGSIVFGLEGDVAMVDWDDLFTDLQIPEAPQTVALDIDLLATIRARLGWATDTLLFYVTGGVAFLDGEFEDLTLGGKKDIFAVGGAVGGGVEWGIAPDLSLKAEALYLIFDDETSLEGLTDAAAPGDEVEIEDGFVVKLGANWRPGYAAGKEAASGLAGAAEGLGDPYNWSGVYIGGHVGWGGLVTDGIYNPSGTVTPDGPLASEAIDLTGVSNLGVLGGGQIGFNWQVGSIVLGVEGDVAFTDWDGAESEFANPDQVMEFEGDLLATIRGRVGWAENDLLLYVTGGVAFLKAELDNTANDGGTTKDLDAWGGAAGVGMEWGATSNLSIKAEGLFLFFDEDTDIEDIGSEGDPGDFFRIDDGFIARIGANWRFNPFR